jgi:hypothetical protein
MFDTFFVCAVRLARRRPEHQRLPARDGNDRVKAGSRPPADRCGGRTGETHPRIDRSRPFASILEPRRPDHISPTHRRATPAAASAGHRRSARWRVLMLRLWIFAPNGAVTNQPRATPWEHVHHQRPSPVRAKPFLVHHGESDIAKAENCGALTGHALPWNTGSQGVALGWHVISPSGRNTE